MITAIALIVGFIMGAGCTCALLFAVRKVAQASGIAEKPVKIEPDAEEPGEQKGKPAFEEQLMNMLNYDGRPKRGKVSADEN